MAPRRRRPKAGSTRMDAALDAMRPMGFPTDAVRKSVKKLLKVYGDDGWAFIEEAAYKLLIDTILEEPEEDEQEHERGLPALGGDSKGSHEQPAPSDGLCLKEATNSEHEEPSRALEVHGSGIYCQGVKLGGVIVEGQDSGSEGVKDHKEMGVEVGFSQAYNPQSFDRVPMDDKCRPCYGWISDDEEDDTVEVTQSGSQTTHLAA